jgi:hypothetical protein
MSEREKKKLITQPAENKLPKTIMEKVQQPNLTWLYCLLTGLVSGFVGFQAGKNQGKIQTEKEYEAMLEKEREKYRALKEKEKSKQIKRFEL